MVTSHLKWTFYGKTKTAQWPLEKTNPAHTWCKRNTIGSTVKAKGFFVNLFFTLNNNIVCLLQLLLFPHSLVRFPSSSLTKQIIYLGFLCLFSLHLFLLPIYPFFLMSWNEAWLIAYPSLSISCLNRKIHIILYSSSFINAFDITQGWSGVCVRAPMHLWCMCAQVGTSLISSEPRKAENIKSNLWLFHALSDVQKQNHQTTDSYCSHNISIPNIF